MKGTKFTSAALAVGLLAGFSDEKGALPDTVMPTIVPAAVGGPEPDKESLEVSLYEAGYTRSLQHNTWLGMLNADPEIAKVQHTLGFKVMQLLSEAGPLTATVNEESREVISSMPAPESLRVISFVAHNRDIANTPGMAGTPPESVTRQFLDEELNLKATFGAISQDSETVIEDTAVEYCQAMDMRPAEGAFDPHDRVNDYIRHKEAICNTAGLLADTALAGAGYPVYVSRIANKRLKEPAAHGADIPLPVLPKTLYDQAAVILRNK